MRANQLTPIPPPDVVAFACVTLLVLAGAVVILAIALFVDHRRFDAYRQKHNLETERRERIWCRGGWKCAWGRACSWA